MPKEIKFKDKGTNVKITVPDSVQVLYPPQENHLTAIPSSELEAELTRRRKEAEEKHKQQVAVLQEKQRKILTKEILDALHPGHGRTSCSDNNICNGWDSRSDGGYRCARCALLEMLDGYFPGDSVLELSITSFSDYMNPEKNDE